MNLFSSKWTICNTASSHTVFELSKKRFPEASRKILNEIQKRKVHKYIKEATFILECSEEFPICLMEVFLGLFKSRIRTSNILSLYFGKKEVSDVRKGSFVAQRLANNWSSLKFW